MRKVLSLVLVLALVLSSFSFSFAGTTKVASDVKGTEYEDAVTVLMSLGVVTGYSDGTYKPAGAVTRAEMAALIVRILGLDTTSSFVAKSNYSDMSGHWADKYVALVAGKNIVKGYPDGTFKPNAQVSFPEAITMIIRALGYTDGCTSLTGTWPSNYMTLATDLDITDDVKVATTEAADRGAVAIMLYNALTVANVTVDKDSMVATKVVLKEDKDGNKTYLTFLSKLDAYESEEPEMVTPEMVDDEDTLCDLSQYVYATVTLYYNDDDQIIAVKEIDEDCDYATGEFDSEDLTITDSDGTEMDVNVSTDTAVYFNGEEVNYEDIVSGDAIDLLDGWTITVYGEQNKKDDFTTVDGIVANAPTGVYMADDDTVEDIADAIEDGNGDLFDIALPTVDDDGDELDMDDIIVKGDVTSLSDIKADDVITVYASANCANDDGDVDCDKITFVVERSTAEIKVKKVDEDDGEVIASDGTVYNMVSEEMNTGVDMEDAMAIGDVEVGTTYTAYLDQFGYIFDMEDVDDAEAGNYAIVVAIDTGDDFDDARLKLFTKDGDTTTFDVDGDDVDIDSITIGAVIEYDTNSSGDIDDVTVLTGNGDYTIDSATAEYKSSSDTFDSQDIASDAVFFDLSGDDTATTTGGIILGEDDDWDVFSKLTDGTEYEAVYYMSEDNGARDEILVMVITDSDDSTNNYFAVNKRSKAENEDGDDVFALDGYKGSTAANDVLTTNRTTAFTTSYTVPGIYVVKYDGNDIKEAYWIGEDNDTTVAAIVKDEDGIVYTEKVTTSGTGDYFKTGSGVINIADDCVIYVEVYDDGDLDSFKVGKIGDIDKDDYVTYILNDDGDAELVIVTDEDDYDDAWWRN